MATHNITLTATDKTKGALANVDKGLDKATRRALMLKGAIGIAGAAMAVFGAIKLFKGPIDDMDRLQKAAQNLGINTEAGFAKFQVLSKLLEEGGINASEMDRGLRNMTTRMEQGLKGNKTYAKVMEKIGTSLFDANGELKSTPDLFIAVAEAIQEGKIDIVDAQKILGEVVGVKMFNLFDGMAQKGVSVGAAMKDVAENMNILSQDDVAKAAAFNDALGRLNTAFTSLLQEAILPLLPGMTEFIKDLVANAPGLLESFNEKIAGLKPVFDGLGLIVNTVIIPALNAMFTAFDLIMQGVTALHDTNPLLTEFALIVGAVAAAFLLLNPVALVVAGIVTAIIGFKTAYEYIDEMKTRLGSWTAVFDEILLKVTGLKDNVVGAFQDISDKVTALTDSTVGAIRDSWEWLANLMYKNSIVPDMKDALISEFEEMDKKIVFSTENTVKEVQSDYEKLSAVMDGLSKEATGKVMTNFEKLEDFMSDFNQSFNDTLVDGLVDGNLSFDTFAGLWKDTLKDLLKDTLDGGNMLSDIMGSIFGSSGGGHPSALGGGGLGGMLSGLFGGGGGGGIGGMFSGLFGGVSDFFGNIFGGFFANGGSLGAGKVGIVGEQGPELITGPARITSNEDSFGGAAPAVNITIQAIDTQTGTEFLLNNKKQIEGIIQNAFNRRGKQGIY